MYLNPKIYKIYSVIVLAASVLSAIIAFLILFPYQALSTA